MMDHFKLKSRDGVFWMEVYAKTFRVRTYTNGKGLVQDYFGA